MNFLYPAIRSDYDSEDNVTFNTRTFGFMRVLRFNCSTSFNKNFAEASSDMCNRDMGLGRGLSPYPLIEGWSCKKTGSMTRVGDELDKRITTSSAEITHIPIPS